jgi:hypothetical protein
VAVVELTLSGGAAGPAGLAGEDSAAVRHMTEVVRRDVARAAGVAAERVLVRDVRTALEILLLPAPPQAPPGSPPPGAGAARRPRAASGGGALAAASRLVADARDPAGALRQGGQTWRTVRAVLVTGSGPDGRGAAVGLTGCGEAAAVDDEMWEEEAEEEEEEEEEEEGSYTSLRNRIGRALHAGAGGSAGRERAAVSILEARILTPRHRPAQNNPLSIPRPKAPSRRIPARHSASCKGLAGPGLCTGRGPGAGDGAPKGRGCGTRLLGPQRLGSGARFPSRIAMERAESVRQAEWSRSRLSGMGHQLGTTDLKIVGVTWGLESGGDSGGLGSRGQ